ncbi:MAG: helix-turn-helix transcriptional regulator [Chlorobi bacterium]|nr:helix-turn-helix transcriptional regulator [Chlorobiota bacterium]
MINSNFLTNENLQTASRILKAMAHPLRIKILNLLSEKTKLTVTQIHTTLGIEQSTASHHLGILKDKGVLQSERKGKNTYYFLKDQNLKSIIECLSKCSECNG